MTRRGTGLFLLGSALTAAVVVALLARRDGGVDAILAVLVALGVVVAGLIVVGDVLWHRRAPRPSEPREGQRTIG